MKNLNDLNPPSRKVTLSCRLLPEQKFMIAERAKSLGLTLAQYTESKVLQNDSLDLEEKIREQQFEIRRLRKELDRSQKIKAEMEENISSLKQDFEIISRRKLAASKSDEIQLKLSFSTEEELKLFQEKLRKLVSKYKIQNLQSALKLCLEYTFINDTSIFFLEKVSGVFRKKIKNNFSNLNKINSK